MEGTRSAGGVPGGLRFLVALLALAALSLSGCAPYAQFLRQGGSLPLGGGGLEWSPGVTSQGGGVVGAQIIWRF